MPHKINVLVTRIHPMITKLQHINHSSINFFKAKMNTKRKREVPSKLSNLGRIMNSNNLRT